jgi:hypothetical protein
LARDGGDATTINYYITLHTPARVVKTAPSRSGYERVAIRVATRVAIRVTIEQREDQRGDGTPVAPDPS